MLDGMKRGSGAIPSSDTSLWQQSVLVAPGSEARDVMKCLTGHRTTLNNKEFSDPKMPTVLRSRNSCR